MLNEIQTQYNGLGQISVQYQSDQGSVNVSTTPKVQYAYSGLADGSRLSSISDSTGTLESYAYLGDGTIVQASRPQAGDAKLEAT